MAVNKTTYKLKSSAPSLSTTANKKGCYSRFTKKEKEVLYSLFRQYENIIDIKHRKGSSSRKNSMSIRECWQQIAVMYNCHQGISTQRNIKQIQKFWLNSRLRKLFPPSQKLDNSIKLEPEILTSVESAAMDAITTESFVNNNIEATFQEESQHQVTISNGSSNIGVAQHHHHHHHTEEEMIEIADCIEQISTEKLSLNDLLQFKNTTATTTNSASSLTCTSVPSHHHVDNVDAGAVHIQVTKFPITKTKTEQTQTELICSNDSITTQSHPPMMTIPYSTLSSSQHQSNICTSRNYDDVTAETSFEDKLNYFKLKETELRYQEEQIRVEKLRIELEKSKEELKYMQEMHRLQIEEMKTKLRILHEEEKKHKLKNNKCDKSKEN